MSVHKFTYDAAKASAIQQREGVRLLDVLRLDGEPVWLQTFADGPDELYSLEKGTGKTGRPWSSKKFCLAGIPKDGGKTKQVVGKTELTGCYALDQIGGDSLTFANLARCGVYFAVNVLSPDAQRRDNDTVQRVAAVFLDLDGSPLPDAFPLTPTAIVESSAGRFHVYWAVADLDLSEFTTVQKHLAGLYGGDAAVCDLARVMRLPGYWHGKGEEGFLTRLLELNPDAQYTRAELLGEGL